MPGGPGLRTGPRDLGKVVTELAICTYFPWRGASQTFTAPLVCRYTCGLWVAIELNKSLARFLRDLFQIVHPSQTAVLVKSYFNVVSHHP